MANRKRLPSDGPLAPRKSTRLTTKATPTLGGDDSPRPSETATPRPDGDDSSGPSKTATIGSGGDDSSEPSKTATTGFGGDDSSRPSKAATIGSGGDDSSGPSNTATTGSGSDDSSEPSKTATTGFGGDDSSRPSKAATTGPGGDDSSSQNDSGQGKGLGGPEMVQEVAKMVENEDHAELMILELMRKYSFDLSLLQKLLRQNNLNVSFSKVRYVDIAPLVGLDPRVEGDDIPTFEMSYARLPNAVFSKIINDLQELEAQYGRVKKHANEETRSRYLAGYFKATVALFSGIVRNTPEKILEGRIATKGRIEYQFRTYGGVTIVFIEVKLEIGGLTERLNCVAQVIAECDACAWLNHQMGYDVPIMAILCDGQGFYFYRFINKVHANASPQFFLGEFLDGSTQIDLDDTSRKRGLSPKAFYQRLRRACDAFYYVFLSGYRTGLEAYWKSSVERGKAQGRARDSTPGWHKALVYATEALEEATVAWNLYNEGKINDSEASGEKAAKLLAESVREAPFVEETLFSDFSAEMLRV